MLRRLFLIYDSCDGLDNPSVTIVERGPLKLFDECHGILIRIVQQNGSRIASVKFETTYGATHLTIVFFELKHSFLDGEKVIKYFLAAQDSHSPSICHHHSCLTDLSLSPNQTCRLGLAETL